MTCKVLALCQGLKLFCFPWAGISLGLIEKINTVRDQIITENKEEQEAAKTTGKQQDM